MQNGQSCKSYQRKARRDEAGAGVNSYAVEFTNLKDSQITNLSEIMFFVK